MNISPLKVTCTEMGPAGAEFFEYPFEIDVYVNWFKGSNQFSFAAKEFMSQEKEHREVEITKSNSGFKTKKEFQ